MVIFTTRNREREGGKEYLYCVLKHSTFGYIVWQKAKVNMASLSTFLHNSSLKRATKDTTNPMINFTSWNRVGFSHTNDKEFSVWILKHTCVSWKDKKWENFHYW